MFLLTKEQQKLRAELREFVDHEVCPVATELDNRGGFPHDLYARIGKMGYLDAEFEYIVAWQMQFIESHCRFDDFFRIMPG